MVSECYLPVEGTSYGFDCMEGSEQTWNMDEIASEPSSLDGESSRGAASVCYIALDIFL